MYNIIPLIIILISLLVIIVVVSRKFSVLSNLDLKSIPAEKEASMKERIISNRLKRNFVRWGSKAMRIIRPAGSAVSGLVKRSYKKLSEIKDDYKSEEHISTDDLKEKMEQLFVEAEEFKKSNDLPAAEKKYIEIIGMDSKNIDAFKNLAQVYFELKNYEEAKQIFEHILKLKDDDAEAYGGLAEIAKEKGDLNEAKDEYLKSLNINSQRSQTYFDLALVYNAMDNAKEAMLNIKKALDIEPNNPRYLDAIFDMSIINKDKVAALGAYDKLKSVNPDNQKLEEFKNKINEL